MGFNKIYLPIKEKLEQEYNELGHDGFVNKYKKYDSFSDSSQNLESIKFVENKLKNQ